VARLAVASAMTIVKFLPTSRWYVHSQNYDIFKKANRFARSAPTNWDAAHASNQQSAFNFLTQCQLTALMSAAAPSPSAALCSVTRLFCFGDILIF
jgi:hypothetical protein